MMLSFHIYRIKNRLWMLNAYMHLKIWIGLATVFFAVLMIKYYLTLNAELPAAAANPEKYGEAAQTQNIFWWETVQTESECPDTEKTAGRSGLLCVEKHALIRPLRVLIRSDNYQERLHAQVSLTATGDFTVFDGTGSFRYSQGDVVRADYFLRDGLPDECLRISCTEANGRIRILGLKRGQTEVFYPDIIEVSRVADGYRVVNEVDLEEYLPFVLSSEMNRSFPAEALKAQAVCARTYALACMETPDPECLGADLDDSTFCQVYNNKEPGTEEYQAVLDTSGMALFRQSDTGERIPAQIRYFSTSCGVLPTDDFSEESEFARFLIDGRPDDLEYQEPWYRWHTEISADTLRQHMEQLGMSVDELADLEIGERSRSGQVCRLTVFARSGHEPLHVEGEYAIRQFLSPDEEITLQDGTVCQPLTLLPSAWFIMEKEFSSDGVLQKIVLCGGGFGHGDGMSQNGAKRMADSGKTWKEILQFYYPETELLSQLEKLSF